MIQGTLLAVQLTSTSAQQLTALSAANVRIYLMRPYLTGRANRRSEPNLAHTPPSSMFRDRLVPDTQRIDTSIEYPTVLSASRSLPIR